MFFVIKTRRKTNTVVMKNVKKIVCILLLFFSFALLAILGVFFAITKDATLDEEKLILSSTKIIVYNDKATPTANSFFKDNTLSITEIPKYTRNAFIDTEDKRFYSHGGFDVRRIARAALNNLKARSFKEGASTISQQLIKNTHLTQEKTLKRKLKEWKLTRALEKKYTKDEILEKYLRIIYFGHNCFGLRSAADFYFGKTPETLDLADSAILAGIVKSPNNYSPFKNPENCKKRKLCVLNAMLKNGSITQQEKEQAMQKALPQSPHLQPDNNCYLQYVYDEFMALTENYSLPTYENVEIYTYLDENLQNTIQSTCREYEQTDVIAMCLDNLSHGFKACYSTIYNAKRLPGSLLKPLFVYAPALEENVLSPATPILDEAINFGGYSPENFDGKYHGYVSARECVAQSLNIPAVKTLNSLGMKKCEQYAQKVGLPVDKDDLSLSLALGGMKNGYTMQQLVSAYSTLPCGGVYTKGSFISEIKINGKSVYKNPNVSQRAFSEESAYLMTDMLKTAAKTGTAKKLRSLNLPIACKTGTVGTDKGNTDAYAISYTALDSVGVWLGNRDNAFIEHTGGGMPCNFLWNINEYLSKTHTNIPDFKRPDSVREVALDKIGYYDTHTLSLAEQEAPVEYRFTELFKKSCIPTKTSNFFTNPTINPPILHYDGNQVTILFDKEIPLYSYKIDRYDYATHITVYEGAGVKEISDTSVEKDKNYVYTVIPIYKDNQGVPVVLPTITTKAGAPPPNLEQEILDKNWWDY